MATAPKLTRGERFYWDAFGEIQTMRPSTGGMGGLLPIPFDKIRDYADWLNLAEYESDALIFVIRAMDQVFIEIQSSKAKKRSAARKE